MVTDVLKDLYEVVEERKKNPQEGSYTSYLFEKGIDKILKKCAEETGEVIIAAKNKMPTENLKNEICDLLYHLIVLMVSEGVSMEEIYDILEERSKKIGNLKTFHVSNHES